MQSDRLAPRTRSSQQKRPGVFTRAALSIVILVLASGCGRIPFTASASATDRCLESLVPPAVANGIFVEPDDGETPILDELEAARCAIDISVYLLTEQGAIDALGAAVGRDVRVRVMLDEHPFGGGGTQDDVAARLRALGVTVQWSSARFQFSHAKYIVVDQAVAIIMNQNLTFAAVNDNREFGLITTEPEMVTQATTIFAEDWAQEWNHADDGPLIVSPDNSRSRYLELIAGARESIDLYAEVVRDDGIIAALGDADLRGVQVRIIVSDVLEPEAREVANQLLQLGTDVRQASHLYIHSKTMLIDGEIAVIGSQNFTATSLDLNREVASIVDDRPLVDRCLHYFELDWLRASPAETLVESSATRTQERTQLDRNYLTDNVGLYIVSGQSRRTG